MDIESLDSPARAAYTSVAHANAKRASATAWGRFYSATPHKDPLMKIELMMAAVICEDLQALTLAFARIDYATNQMADDLASACNGVDRCAECNGAHAAYDGGELPI